MKSLKTFVPVLLASYILYEYKYFDLTSRQRQKVETLHKKAIRVVTGLLRFTTMNRLYEQALMNTIEYEAEANHAMNMLCLAETQAGTQTGRIYESCATIFPIALHSNTRHHFGSHRNSRMSSPYPEDTPPLEGARTYCDSKTHQGDTTPSPDSPP